MEIEKWVSTGDQMACLDKHEWSVSRLLELSKDLEVREAPIDFLNIYNTCYGDLSLREMVMHMRAVDAANLDYPIILDEDGEIMDGRHRITKAILQGKETIKVVRFNLNPEPCKNRNEKET
jgi:hypothetical protein